MYFTKSLKMSLKKKSKYLYIFLPSLDIIKSCILFVIVMLSLLKYCKRFSHSVHCVINSISKTPAISFFPSPPPPPLNMQTIQVSPLVRLFPPIYRFFSEPSHLKIRFFRSLHNIKIFHP